MATYRITATDVDDAAGDLTITCSPASGSIFHLGSASRTTKTTTVACIAADRAGNRATRASFSVTVHGAHDQLVALEHRVLRAAFLGRTRRTGSARQGSGTPTGSSPLTAERGRRSSYARSSRTLAPFRTAAAPSRHAGSGPPSGSSPSRREARSPSKAHHDAAGETQRAREVAPFALHTREGPCFRCPPPKLVPEADAVREDPDGARGARPHNCLMLRDTDCVASLTFAATVGEPDGRTVCPACGALVELGYGGRIPVRPVTAARSQLATGATSTEAESLSGRQTSRCSTCFPWRRAGRRLIPPTRPSTFQRRPYSSST